MKRIFTLTCMIASIAVFGFNAYAKLDLSTIEKIIPIYMNQLVMEDNDLDTKIVQDLRINDNALKLWLWDNTYSAPAATGKGFYDNIGGYLNLNVIAGWSGLGFCAVDAPTTGAPLKVDFTKLISEGWYFHGAFKSTSNTRAHHVYFCGTNEAHAHFSVGVGTASDDKTGKVYPNVTPNWSTTGWNEVNLPVSSFEGFSARDVFGGNYFCVLSGAQPMDFALDAIFFYKTKNNGIKSSKADALEVVVRDSEIEILNTNSPAYLYNLSGANVGSSVDNIISTTGLVKGVYVVKSEGAVAKVIIK